MSNIDTYKKLIKGFDNPNPELLKHVLGEKTKKQYLNELKENMHTDICEWQRWYSILNTIIRKVK